MKKILLLLLFLVAYITNGQVTTNPSPIEIDQSVTITVDISTLGTCNNISSPTSIYAHLGIGDDNDEYGFDVVGEWGEDDGEGQMSNNGDGTWSITLTPNVYFYELTAQDEANVTKMGMVFRNPDGTQELKLDSGGDPQCVNFVFNVGSFQVTQITPILNSANILNSGDNLSISATNTGGNADYVLKANGSIINQSTTASYSFTHTNITSNQNYELEATLNSTTITKKFSVIIDPGTSFVPMPAGLVDGINYNVDPTKATLVLDATFKDFIYVAGSFNNWQPDATYAMKKDFSGKFWLELTGLASGDVETYQYWVVDKTPIVNSPQLVKTADPYSTLVLSPFDDP